MSLLSNDKENAENVRNQGNRRKTTQTCRMQISREELLNEHSHRSKTAKVMNVEKTHRKTTEFFAERFCAKNISSDFVPQTVLCR